MTEACVDFEAQRLAAEVVDDVEGAKASATPQRIGHEVGRPGFVRTLGNIQRLRDPRRQPALATSRQIELELFVDPPEPALAPRVPIGPEAVVQQAEAVTGIVRDMLRDRLNGWCIVATSRELKP